MEKLIACMTVTLMASSFCGCGGGGGGGGSPGAAVGGSSEGGTGGGGSGGPSKFVGAVGLLDDAFNGTGKVVTPFGSGIKAWANSVAVQSDGKIVAAGTIYNMLYQTNYGVARYLPNGSLDASFGSAGKVTTLWGGSNNHANAMVLQPDGKIVVVGDAAVNGGSWNDFAVVRYQTDGSLDPTFNNGSGKVLTDVGGSTPDSAGAVALQSNGKIVVAGYTSVWSQYYVAVVRYNADGSIDTNFGTQGKVTTSVGSTLGAGIRAMAIQPDGKIVVAGYAGLLGKDFAMVRYDVDGSLDSTFGTGGKVTTTVGLGEDIAYAMALQPDGKILLAGSAYSSPHYYFGMVRYNVDGSLDTNFGFDKTGKVTTAVGGYDDYARAIILQPDGNIVVAGYSTTILGESDFAMVRYKSDGTVDTSFGDAGKVTTDVATSIDYANAMTLQSDGKIVVAGYERPTFPASLTNWDSFAVVRYK